VAALTAQVASADEEKVPHTRPCASPPPSQRPLEGSACPGCVPAHSPAAAAASELSTAAQSSHGRTPARGGWQPRAERPGLHTPPPPCPPGSPSARRQACSLRRAPAGSPAHQAAQRHPERQVDRGGAHRAAKGAGGGAGGGLPGGRSSRHRAHRSHPARPALQLPLMSVADTTSATAAKAGEAREFLTWHKQN
jgi:hypothetical protein